MSMLTPLSPAARWLGLAGLLPQLLAVLLLTDVELRWTAIAAGFGYAALIFSFLGGVWWGVGISAQASPRWVYAAGVLPSLIGFAAYLPWIFGWTWPGPQLAVIAVALILSPLVDRAIARTVPLPEGWLALRCTLSLGLGSLTAILAVVAILLDPA
ncbi:MAG: hypothetical protein RL425_1820 [Pseudomonadota bacterium]|jgi:hypothetical protein